MRVPPNNTEAEKSVLGCMMQDREALSLALELLTADDFYQPANREIFDAMHALNTQGMPVDLVTVDEELTRRGTLEGAGGSGYLVELTQSMPSAANARAYVQIVDEKATLRRMIKATGEISTACYAQAEQVYAVNLERLQTLEAQREAMRTMCREQAEKMKSVLTTEQFMEWSKMQGPRPHRDGRHAPGMRRGAPDPDKKCCDKPCPLKDMKGIE